MAGSEPSRYVAEHTHVSHLVVDNEQPFPYQLDGDYLGETTRLEFTHEPDAVRLVFPGPKSEELRVSR